MVERLGHTIWFRCLFLMLAAFIIFVQLLPMDVGQGRLPGPDVLVLLALSWVLMRQEYAPVFLIAVVFLIADILFMRPIGLWAVLVVLGTEYLRSRVHQMREVSFLLEWVAVAAIIGAMTLIYVFVQSLFAVPQPPLGMTLIQLLFTIIFYPIVVVLGGRFFGVRKVRIGETDTLGLSP